MEQFAETKLTVNCSIDPSLSSADDGRGTPVALGINFGSEEKDR